LYAILNPQSDRLLGLATARPLALMLAGLLSLAFMGFGGIGVTR